jgi:hypothetical protein
MASLTRMIEGKVSTLSVCGAAILATVLGRHSVVASTREEKRRWQSQSPS